MNDRIDITNICKYFNNKAALMFLPDISEKAIIKYGKKYKIDLQNIEKACNKVGLKNHKIINGIFQVASNDQKTIKSIALYLAYKFQFAQNNFDSKLDIERKKFDKELISLKEILSKKIIKINFTPKNSNSKKDDTEISNGVLIDYLLKYSNVKEVLNGIEYNKDLFPEIKKTDSFYKQYTLTELLPFSEFLNSQSIFNDKTEIVKFIVDVCDCFIQNWWTTDPHEYLLKTFNKADK